MKRIDEIDVFTAQGNAQNPSEQTDAMTFSLYGLTRYEVRYSNGRPTFLKPGGLR